MMHGWEVEVTRLRAPHPQLDQYGEPIGDDAETPTVLPRALYAPGRSTEPVVAGEASVTFAPTLYWRRRHPDVIETDRLLVDGEVFDVDGAPNRWPEGTVVTLRATRRKTWPM